MRFLKCYEYNTGEDNRLLGMGQTSELKACTFTSPPPLPNSVITIHMMPAYSGDEKDSCLCQLLVYCHMFPDTILSSL